jgi:hypothetical protein
MSTVTSAIEHIGLTPIAKRFGYRPSAIQKWRDVGALPQTELSGMTDYASEIADMTDGEYTKDQLIHDTRVYWSKRHNGSRTRGRKTILRRGIAWACFMNASCQLLPAQPLGVITPKGEVVANDSVCGVQLLVFMLAAQNKEPPLKLVA